MKQTLVMAAFILLGLSCRAEYRPLELYEMIIKAEKIVYGTVVELDHKYFTLEVEGSLTSDSGTLRIARFQDWPCAARWTQYEVGQQLFLFLTVSDGDLVSMSGGNEGEHPIVNDTVYIHGLSLSPPPSPGVTLKSDLIYFETDHFDIYDADYYGIQWDLSTLIESVSFIRRCFDFTYGQYHVPMDWRTSCDKSNLEQICKVSKLVKWVNYKATKKTDR